MSLDKNSAESLARSTGAQRESVDWARQRKGRITASNLNRVASKYETLKKKNANTEPLLIELMGYKDKVTTIAMKHGISMEAHAKRKYTTVMKARTPRHSRFHTEETGLHVLPGKEYIGASPDLLVSCSCHGKGLCEIKFRYKCADQKPSPDNWEHLVNTELV